VKKTKKGELITVFVYSGVPQETIVGLPSAATLTGAIKSLINQNTDPGTIPNQS
jgi:hypothetical protein